MGLGDFIRKLRGDSRAMPDPESPEFQQLVEGSALPGSAEMGEAGWESAGGGHKAHVSTSRSDSGGPQISASGDLDEDALREAGVPADSAAAAAAALKQIQQAFGGGAAGSVTIHGDGVETIGGAEVSVGPRQTLDLRGMSGLREAMHETMRAHGVDPTSGESVDASRVEGLQEALLAVLAQHGINPTRPDP